MALLVLWTGHDLTVRNEGFRKVLWLFISIISHGNDNRQRVIAERKSKHER